MSGFDDPTVIKVTGRAGLLRRISPRFHVQRPEVTEHRGNCGGEGGTRGAGKEQSGLQAPAEASDTVWALGQACGMGGRCSKAHPELWEFSALRSTGRFVHVIAAVSCSLGDAGVALGSMA